MISYTFNGITIKTDNARILLKVMARQNKLQKFKCYCIEKKKGGGASFKIIPNHQTAAVTTFPLKIH